MKKLWVVVLIVAVIGLSAITAYTLERIWTAVDIKCGKIILSPHTDTDGNIILTITRPYQFIDVEGNTIGSLVNQRLVRELPWASIPTDIQDVFIKLHNWTRAEALVEAGLAE